MSKRSEIETLEEKLEECQRLFSAQEIEHQRFASTLAGVQSELSDTQKKLANAEQEIENLTNSLADARGNVNRALLEADEHQHDPRSRRERLEAQEEPARAKQVREAPKKQAAQDKREDQPRILLPPPQIQTQEQKEEAKKLAAQEKELAAQEKRDKKN